MISEMLRRMRGRQSEDGEGTHCDGKELPERLRVVPLLSECRLGLADGLLQALLVSLERLELRDNLLSGRAESLASLGLDLDNEERGVRVRLVEGLDLGRRLLDREGRRAVGPLDGRGGSK